MPGPPMLGSAMGFIGGERFFVAPAELRQQFRVACFAANDPGQRGRRKFFSVSEHINENG